MRHFRFTLTPEGGAYASADRRLADVSAVTRESILDIELLGDGTVLAIYLLRGDPQAVTAVFEEAPEVLSYHIFNVEGDRFNVHVNLVPDDAVRTLLEIGQRQRIVLDPPIEFVNGGESVRIDVGGVQELVQEAADEFPDDGPEVTIEQIGRYDPTRNSLLGSLTRRQREVLRVALDNGYYDIPRRATHEDLAERLDCSAGTVGEHLRKIEARVLSSLAE